MNWTNVAKTDTREVERHFERQQLLTLSVIKLSSNTNVSDLGFRITRSKEAIVTWKTSCCQSLSSFSNAQIHFLTPPLYGHGGRKSHKTTTKNPQKIKLSAWFSLGISEKTWCLLCDPFIGKRSKRPNSCRSKINAHTVHDSSAAKLD